MPDYQSIYQQARRWVLEAGENLRASIRERVNVEYKTSVKDLVTQKDREIEAFFVQKIGEAFPTHKILGEEGMATEQEFDPAEHIVWIIDPIDGTTNFVHQRQNFAISIGFFAFDKPVFGIIYDPIREECFHALREEGAYLNDQPLQPEPKRRVEEAVLGINSIWLTPNKIFHYEQLLSLVQHLRGTRSIGSAALEMAYVACGRLDGYISLRLSPWDFAGGYVILEEVGIKQTTIHNQAIPIFEKSSVFVAPKQLHQEILTLLEKPIIKEES